MDWKTASESIWSVRIDGSRLHRLKGAATGTGTAGWGEGYFDPAPAPDGMTLAFSYTSDLGHGQDTQIAAVKLQGEDAHLSFAFPTTTADFDLLTFDPAWSPDGQHLAYGVLDAAAHVGGLRGVSDLYVSASSGSEPRRVGSPTAAVSSPAWSRDGEWIVFASAPNDIGDVWLVRADGTGLRQVTHTKADERHAAWLPARP